MDAPFAAPASQGVVAALAGRVQMRTRCWVLACSGLRSSASFLGQPYMRRVLCAVHGDGADIEDGVVCWVLRTFGEFEVGTWRREGLQHMAKLWGTTTTGKVGGGVKARPGHAAVAVSRAAINTGANSDQGMSNALHTQLHKGCSLAIISEQPQPRWKMVCKPESRDFGPYADVADFAKYLLPEKALASVDRAFSLIRPFLLHPPPRSPCRFLFFPCSILVSGLLYLGIIYARLLCYYGPRGPHRQNP
ncbi:hypothetical protein FIBSPDRAFT_896669 [Athelia psychrophila]|uniref:Uncharacterized protein n=1 Tax=Athelia psychrophila TaxID=1759441 RepID=A0A166D3U3_9AGAM|nr:hypothetical protein FIBSPDRAFT_896669 [Fibularhizoctonia sp. CBS 109695]